MNLFVALVFFVMSFLYGVMAWQFKQNVSIGERILCVICVFMSVVMGFFSVAVLLLWMNDGGYIEITSNGYLAVGVIASSMPGVLGFMVALWAKAKTAKSGAPEL